MRITIKQGTGTFAQQVETQLTNNTNSNDKTIDLSGNKLGKIPAKELIELTTILQKKPYTILNLALNGFNLSQDDGLEKIIQNLAKTSINTLIIASNFISFEKLQKVLTEIAKIKSLEHLDLSSENLGKLKRNQLEILFDLLKNSSLKSIKLDGNLFNQNYGAAEVADILTQSLPNSCEIVLDNQDSYTRALIAAIRPYRPQTGRNIKHHFYASAMDPQQGLPLGNQQAFGV